MGDLIISGGGLTAVGTDEMLEHARELSALAPQIEGWVVTLLSPAAQPPGTAPSPQWRADSPEVYMLAAHTALREAEEQAKQLASELNEAAEGYGRTERMIQQSSQFGGAVLGWVMGFASPMVLLAAVSAALSSAVGVLAATAFTGSPAATLKRLSLVIRHSGILSNPMFVAFVRTTISSVDDGMLGAAHLPLPLALGLDDDATGWFGLRGAATAVVALAGPRLLKETAVTATPSGAAAAGGPPAAGGFSDLAARIPPGGVGKPQVRIEKYLGDDGTPRWIVYAGGTVDGGFAATTEPFDDTSNVQGVAQLDPGSVRATLDALKQAGAEPGDAVLSVGYSQGGIVATDVVTRGGYTNAGLVTFGSPTGQMDVPPEVPNVAVEINNDMVPSLGGDPKDAQHGGLERTVVRRTIYDDTHPPPADQWLPAHNIANYRDTARLMDASGDPRLNDMRSRIADFTDGRPPEVSMWRADRVPAASHEITLAPGPAPALTPHPVL